MFTMAVNCWMVLRVIILDVFVPRVFQILSTSFPLFVNKFVSYYLPINNLYTNMDNDEYYKLLLLRRSYSQYIPNHQTLALDLYMILIWFCISIRYHILLNNFPIDSIQCIVTIHRLLYEKNIDLLNWWLFWKPTNFEITLLSIFVFTYYTRHRSCLFGKCKCL